MAIISRKKFSFFLLAFLLPGIVSVYAQTNLVLNGNFEDINTCTEYNSECGVEGWFYLNDVKVQMLSNEDGSLMLGSNSFGLYYNWHGHKQFFPVIGTILPCRLQKDMRYVFRGLIKKARVNARLILKPGVALGEFFYVPNRPFIRDIHPDSITEIKLMPKTGFYQFEYSFVATGKEKFLTFGTYIQEDTSLSKTAFIGTQTISIIIDNFQLFPTGISETDCSNYIDNKEKIYNYNFRHKEMDYSLYGKGDLAIKFNKSDSGDITRNIEPVEEKPVKTDTLKLGDVFFDFNKAKLKPEALKMLSTYFKSENGKSIDSIYIEGHTDSVGTDNRNILLSKQRSESVEAWLAQNKILDTSQLQVHPFGESRPIAPNKTPQGRALNRRVELIIFRKTEE